MAASAASDPHHAVAISALVLERRLLLIRAPVRSLTLQTFQKSDLSVYHGTSDTPSCSRM